MYGVVEICLIGLYILPRLLHGRHYYKVFVRALRELLEDNACGSIFQTILEPGFPEKWIGRGGPVLWPVRSLYLTPLAFFVGTEAQSCIDNAYCIRRASCCPDSSSSGSNLRYSWSFGIDITIHVNT